MSYKFEWLICILVFAAGFIWSHLIFPSDFWRVQNIHDLFEIFGVVATSLAVYVAATWKRQLSSTRDYELARKAAVAALKYKESLLGVWDVAASCLAQVNSTERLEDRMRDAVILTTEDRVMRSERLREELRELIVECRAIWKNGIDKDLSKVLAFEEICVNCAQTYLLTIRPLTNPVTSITARYSLGKFQESFAASGLVDAQDAQKYIQEIFDPINNKLDSMMK